MGFDAVRCGREDGSYGPTGCNPWALIIEVILTVRGDDGGQVAFGG